MSQAKSTTNHDEIRRWIESRNGHPAFVTSTRRGASGLLRVDFNRPEEGFEEISWDQFFDTFDDSNLAFLYQETTATGRKSRFNKFVERDQSLNPVRAASGDGFEDEDERRAGEDEDEDEEEEEEEEEDEEDDEDWDEDEDEDEDEEDDEDEDEDEVDEEDEEELDEEDLDDDDDVDEDEDEDEDDEDAR